MRRRTIAPLRTVSVIAISGDNDFIVNVWRSGRNHDLTSNPPTSLSVAHCEGASNTSSIARGDNKRGTSPSW
jgi:hypothetical protein